MFVVSGFSGSGKTTLCDALSRITKTQPVRTSDFLIRILEEERSKEERLFAWQDRSANLLTDREIRAFSEADAEHLRIAQETGGIHESMTLPLRLDPAEDVCRIFLDVESEVRYRRVAARHSINLEDARLLVMRKDAQTQLYIERAYRLLVGTEAHLKYYDVVISVDGDGSTNRRIGCVSTAHQTLLEQTLQQVEQRVRSV